MKYYLSQEEFNDCVQTANQIMDRLKQEPCNDILDKIKAEIEALPKTYPFVNHVDAYVKEDDVRRIINKYNKKEVNE